MAVREDLREGEPVLADAFREKSLAATPAGWEAALWAESIDHVWTDASDSEDDR